MHETFVARFSNLKQFISDEELSFSYAKANLENENCPSFFVDNFWLKEHVIALVFVSKLVS